jgi:hypothetical protein
LERLSPSGSVTTCTLTQRLLFFAEFLSGALVFALPAGYAGWADDEDAISNGLFKDTYEYGELVLTVERLQVSAIQP